MEFKEIKLNIDGLKWMKDNLEISETEENELKELQLLLEQREKMLDMLNKVCKKLKGNGFPMLQEEIEQLIKESTEL
jgi:hypothetical protein